MSRILITGFPGFLATGLLPRLLKDRPTQNVVCLIEERMRAAAEARRRQSEVENPPQPESREEKALREMADRAKGRKEFQNGAERIISEAADEHGTDSDVVRDLKRRVERYRMDFMED